MTFWCLFWRFIVRSQAAKTYCQPPPFCLVLLWIQTTWWQEKSCRAVVRSAVWRQSTFQSVSGRGPHRVRGWWVLSRARSLSLPYCIAGAPHRSGQISETAALYDTLRKYRERWVYTSWKRGQNRTDPGWFRVKPHLFLTQIKILSCYRFLSYKSHFRQFL